MPTNILAPLSRVSEANDIKRIIDLMPPKDAKKAISGFLNLKFENHMLGLNSIQQNTINKNLVKYVNQNIQDGVNHRGILEPKVFKKIARRLDVPLPLGFQARVGLSKKIKMSESLKARFNEAANNYIPLDEQFGRINNPPVTYYLYENPRSLSELTSQIFPNDPTVANLDFSHLNRISENDNGQNRGFKIGTDPTQDMPRTANGVLKDMSERLLGTRQQINENVREHIIKPVFKHMLQELANPDMSDDAKSNKLLILEGLALSLGNCNTPVVDYFVQANIGLLPKEKRLISEENLELFVEKTAIKDRLRTELSKENLSFDNEAVEAMESLVSSIYTENLPSNALKIDGGRKLPYTQSNYLATGLGFIKEAHKACLIDLVCKTDENNEPLKNEAGNPILDPKKMAIIASEARLASGTENAQDVFAKKVSDFIIEKLNEEKYEPLMDLVCDPENYTNGNIPDVIKEKDQKDLFIEKCTEKGISDPVAVEAFFEEFKNDLQTKIDKELELRKPESSLQQETSLDIPKDFFKSMAIPTNITRKLSRQKAMRDLTVSNNSPTQSPQRQRSNSRTS